MIIVRLWALIRGWLSLATLACGIAVALPAAAQQSSGYTSFVESRYYLGHQGTPPTLQEFAGDPSRYLRSQAAYNSLKQGFETASGRALSDADFKALLSSGNVRLVDCIGRINTTGINSAGALRWSQRNCYAGEKLIELYVGNRWVVVASQGCFNLVQPIIAPPVAQQCRFVRTEVRRTADGHVFVNGIHNHDKYCGNDVYLPGISIVIPGGVQTSSRLVCE